MSEVNRPHEEGQLDLAPLKRPTGRRDFLKVTGMGAAVAFIAGCDPERTRTIVETLPPDTVRIPPPAPPPPPPAVTIDFGSDVGILNYALALETLESVFYTRVVANPYQGITDRELRVLTDLRDHEVIHREFYRAAIRALGGTPVSGLVPNFTAVDFTNRTSVLTFARNFENTGVGAYNGAGQFIRNRDILTVAGKVVSVEARHVSALDDLLRPGRITRDFAPREFDHALPPDVVLATVAPFVQNQVRLTNVPGGFVSADRS